MRHEQQTLQGHIRIFATIDFGQSVVSRLIASFIQDNPALTVELSLSNRALHMIQEGCEAGIIAGEITDESVVARSIGKIARYPAATPTFLISREAVKAPADLKDWPWIALLGSHFGGSKDVTLHKSDGDSEVELPIWSEIVIDGRIDLLLLQAEAIEAGNWSDRPVILEPDAELFSD